MASLLQGFEEVQLVKLVGKTVLTVTDSAIRFNKAPTSPSTAPPTPKARP